MSECRSFGSSHHHCSQSRRKISVGVVVESLAQARHKTVREDEGYVPTRDKITSSKGNSGEERFKGEIVSSVSKGQLNSAPGRETSPVVSTRSFLQKIPAARGANDAPKSSSLLPSKFKHKQFNGEKEAQTTFSVQYSDNQTIITEPVDGNREKPDGFVCRRNGLKDGTGERVEQFLFITADNAPLPEKELVGDKTNKTGDRGSEALKMKIWEILGTVSSPKKPSSKVQALQTGANDLKSDQKVDEKSDPLVKHRQGSDSIESDSETPNHIVKRPVTRSLTRKRAPSMMQPKKTKNNKPSPNYKQKYLAKNAFSLKGRLRKLGVAVGGGSPMFKRNDNERKSFLFDPPRISFSNQENEEENCQEMAMRKDNERKSSIVDPPRMPFPGQENEDKIQQEMNFGRTELPAEKLSLPRRMIGKIDSLLSQRDSDATEPNSIVQEKYSQQSPVMKMIDQLEDTDGPVLEKNMHQLEDLPSLSLKNIIDPPQDTHSPAFDFKTTINNSSPITPQKVNQWGVADHSFVKKVDMQGICGFKNLSSSKHSCHETITPVESSDVSGYLKDSPPLEAVPVIEEKDTENRLSESFSEGRDSECYGNCSSVEGHGGRRSMSPEIGTFEKLMPELHPAKRLCSPGVNSTESDPDSASLKGTEENYGLQHPLEQNLEDGLASAVALFSLALERVKSKVKLAISKKSAEILVSVAEEIRLQLQNVESQTQTDLAKLKRIGISKRKHLETSFQDQQEQLRAIHERFKEQVKQLLHDCRSSIEGMEAHQRDIKGIMEKQKTLQRKLLLQAEETIETQLNDAHRRIIGVHKLGREKMRHLQYAIADCLKEGI